MKNLNRVRIAMAASAALVLTTMGSSASAQQTREEYCSDVAWQNCSWRDGYPTQVTLECWQPEYEACMNDYSAVDVNKRVIGDRRSEVQLASRPAAVPWL